MTKSILLITMLAILAAAPAPVVTDLKSPAGPGSEEPNLTVGPDGRVYLSWLEPVSPNGYGLRFSIRGPQGWSAPNTIARGTNWFVSQADFPSLAVLSDGTLAANGLVAVYRDRSDKEIRDISIARYANGRWSPPEALSKDGWEIDGCPINGPAVSSIGKNVAVAWFTAPDEKPQVYLLMSTDSGKTFGKKIPVDGGNPAGRVEVVSLPSGVAVVSWMERIAQGPRIHVRRFDANGVATAPIDVSQAAGVRSGGFPKMIASGNDLILAWTDSSEPSHVRTAAVSF